MSSKTTEKKNDKPADPKADKKQEESEENLSEEDQVLKEKLELCLDRLGERDIKMRDFSYAEMIKEVQGATTSVTSVPKPLKFLSMHY